MLTETRAARGQAPARLSEYAMPPPLWTTLRAAGRFATRWIAVVGLGLAPALASADHGGLPPLKSGLDWTTWLLIVGAIAAVGIAAWAFFAPDRPEGRPGSTPPDRSESESPRR
jgi:hypothetical protein